MSLENDRYLQAFAKRLKQAVQFRGIRNHGCRTRIRESFSERGIAISNTSIGRWFDGVHLPSTDNILALAEILNINAEWLMTGNGEMSSTLAVNEAGEPTNIIVRYIPQLEADDVSPWMERGITTEKVIPFFGELGRNAFVIALPDQSMAPKFVKGTMFVVDPSRVISPKRPVMALVMGCAIFGYPVKRPGAIMIEGENLNYGPTMANPADVIGPVVSTAQQMFV